MSLWDKYALIKRNETRQHNVLIICNVDFHELAAENIHIKSYIGYTLKKYTQYTQ